MVAIGSGRQVHGDGLIAARIEIQEGCDTHTKGTSQMEVKEAVRSAKAFVSDLFADERILHVGLEEVKFNEQQGIWEITIGFYRPWNRSLQLPNLDERSYKIVHIKDEDGQVVSVTHRALTTVN